MVRWTPLVVVYSRVVALPALIFIRWTVLPSFFTIIMWVRVSILLTSAAPILMVWVKDFMPYMSAAPRTPDSSAFRTTFWWAGQYLAVRYMTCRSVIQRQAPRTGFSASTFSAASTEALSVTSWLNVT